MEVSQRLAAVVASFVPSDLKCCDVADGLLVKFDYQGLFRELRDPNIYTDKKFHSVVIKRDTKITMQVDNYPTVVLDNVGSVSGLQNPSKFYIGNSPGGGGRSNGFIGCISRVRFNHLVPLKATEGLDKSDGAYFGNCGQLAPTIDPFWKPEFYQNWPSSFFNLLFQHEIIDVSLNFV